MIGRTRPDEADILVHEEDPAASPRSSSGRAGRNVVALVVSEVLGKVATLAFTVLVARELGATAFGSFSYALAFGILLATFIAWGFDPELLRRGSADLVDLDTVLGRALLLRLAHTVPILVGGALLGTLTRPDARSTQVLLLVLVAAVLDCFGDAGRTAATARERPGAAGLALVVQRVAACVLAVVVLALGGGIVAVSAGYLASSAVGLAVLGALLHRMGVRPRFRGVSRPELLEMWRSAGMLGIEAVLGVALFRVDALILGALTTDAEVAAYAVGYRLMETVLFVTWAVTRPLFPTMVRAPAGRPRVAVAENALAVIGAVFVPYGVVMLVQGGGIIHLLFGQQYGGQSVVALQWLAFAPVAFALNYLCGYLFLAQDRKSYILGTTVFALVVNVALNAVLIPSLGAEGAAIATTGSYVIEGVLSLVLVARGASAFFGVHRALLLCCLASLPMAAVLIFVQGPVLLVVAAGCVVYAVAYLLLVRWRDPAQLDVLLSLVRRR